MGKFKVGDELRVVRPRNIYTEPYLNKVGIVKDTDFEGANIRGLGYFYDDEVDLVEPEPVTIQDAVDLVNHPPHYNRFPVEVINITEQLDFNRGNAVKYLARAGFKEGVDEMEDLSKAAWYVARAIEKLTKDRESNG